jgi:hypothetical protein
LGNQVGIGIAAQNYKLSVVDSQAGASDADQVVSLVNTDSSASDKGVLRLGVGDSAGINNRFVTFYAGSTTDNDGTGVGRIRLNAAGDGVQYQTGSADIAEYMTVPSTEAAVAGDIIAVTSTGNVKASSSSNVMIGVVSDTAGFVGNATSGADADANKQIVGIAGFVNTKVTGTIAVGDPITAGSTAGVGVKATSAGYIIGKAAATHAGATTDRILINILPGWYDPNVLATATDVNFGDTAVTKTIDIGGVTSDGTDTVNISTNSTSADVITVGNNNAATTVAITGGDDWSITGAGALTLASLTRGADTVTDFTGNGLEMSSGSLQLATTTGGAGLTYTSGVLAVGAGTGLSVGADSVGVNTDAEFSWTNAHTYSFTGVEKLGILSALSGTVNVVSITATPGTTAGTTSGLTITQDDSLNPDGLDSAIVIGNEMGPTIGAAIKITDGGGGGFTSVIDNLGTLISGAELDVLDAGITYGELTNSGTLTVTTADINGGTIDGTIIGGASAAAGTFTTLTANTSLTRGTDTITDFTGNGLEMSVGSLQLATTTGGAGLTYTSGVLAVGAGSGITVNADDVTVDLTAATDALSSTTSSGSGLEVLASGLTLLQGCSNGQLLKWNETSDVWECSADSTGGSPSFDTITGGTNTTAAMVVGSGASLNFTGTGTINASTLGGATFAAPGSIGGGTPGSGAFTSLSASTSITRGLDTITDFTGNGLEMSTGSLQLATTTGGAGLTYTSGVLAVGAGSGIVVNADDVDVDEDFAFNWTNSHSFSFNATENLTVSSDLAGTVNVLGISTTPSGTAGTTAGINISQADSVNTNGLDAAMTIANVDTNLPIGAAIKLTDAGGGFTSIIDNLGTLISGAELNVLDAGITYSELTDSGTLTVTTADINGGAIDGTTIGGASAAVGTFTTLTANTSVTRGTDTITDFSGNGLTVSSGSLTINVPAATDGLSATTSSGSGLEVLSAGLALLQGCTNGQILEWNETTDVWACGNDDAGGGSSTLQIAYDNGNTILTTTGRDIAFTLGEVAAPTALTLENQDTAGTSAQRIFNSIASGTLTNGLLIEQTGAGTMTNAIQIAETAGTITDGILITGTLSNILNSASIDITGAGAITGATGLTLTSGNITTPGNISTTSTGTITSAGLLTATSGVSVAAGQSYTGAGAVTLSSGAATALTIDSGTIGALDLGAGANAKTITLGNTTTTTALNINTGTGGINLGDNANAKTIDIGGVTNSGTDTINIATEGTAADVISIGNSNAATTLAMTGGNDWSISAAGAANFTTTTGSGLSNCVGANQKLQWSSSTSTFSCVSEGVLQTRSFNDPADVAWADNTTTELFTTPAGRANITPSSASNSVLVLISVAVDPGGAVDSHHVAVTRTATGSTADCTSGTVDSEFGGFTTETSGNYVATNSFLHSPATTSNVSYTVCTSASSVLGSAATKTDATITLIEISNSTADLAEVYSTNDESLASGDVVSLDGSLRAGVKKSSGAYDSGVLGIVSTAPALVIGGTDGEGVSAVPVALSGRVPVKVNVENGAVKAGDLLTSSSTPGVAMKATKAGAIIGSAMSDYSGGGVGTVLAFVKNGSSTGSKIGSIVPGMVESGADFGRAVLSSFVSDTKLQERAESDLSDVIADRVAAGVEVITPKLTVQDIDASGIFKMVDAAGNENVRIEASGSAVFMGTVRAKKIIADQIEGYEILTDRIASLSDAVSTFSAVPVSTPAEGLSIAETIASIFRNTVEFFGKVIFKSEVFFAGRPTFNKDTAGFAFIKADQAEVEIKFDKEYANLPVVTASINLVGGVNVAEVPGYAVFDLSTKGFKIRLARNAGFDMQFSWIALAVSEAKIFEGSVSGSTTSVPVTTPTTPAPPPEADQPLAGTPTVEVTEATESTPASSTETITPSVSLPLQGGEVATQSATPVPSPTEVATPTPSPTL